MRPLPYQIASLLYFFDDRDRVLLMERAQEPNRGLWSPCGGKLRTEAGESPYECACREAFEEVGVRLTPNDLHLAGLVCERAYQGQSHWLMFLFEIKPRLRALPPPHREGRFAFLERFELDVLSIPETDREQIWPLFWRHRGGFFSVHCVCEQGGGNSWRLEQSTLLSGTIPELQDPPKPLSLTRTWNQV